MKAACSIARLSRLAAIGFAMPSSAGTPSGQFMPENAAAMVRIHAAMEIRPTGDIDRDSVAMMVPHHQGGIDMAVAVLRYSRKIGSVATLKRSSLSNSRKFSR
jgi:uncharacterized protein (DUF305 family)